MNDCLTCYHDSPQFQETGRLSQPARYKDVSVAFACFYRHYMVFMRAILFIEWMLLLPIVAGSLFAILCFLAMVRFRLRRRPAPKHIFSSWPPVTVLKPVYGLEKDLLDNLRSACLQDYPDYQVVFSAQRLDDPAIPLLHQLQSEFGPEKVTVAIENYQVGTNGKINNMIGGIKHARHELLVISDSDVYLRPDYLKTIVAPLADPEVGFVCTLYKAARADSWFEKMELLTLNADLMTNIVFAHVTGAARLCIGASTALRRSTLEAFGALDSLADYLVEDFEMGRRIWESGKKDVIVPYFIDTIMDLKTPAQWWGHQVYWDQNSRSARPVAYFFTIILRSIPFALLYAIMRLGDPVGLAVLAAVLLVRLSMAALIMGWGLGDREGVRSLWLLPFRDLTGLVSWFLAYTKRTTVWRGAQFILTNDGRLVSREGQP
jgi:ceramide glucosyltransferase